ncbi:MAG: hypothetical protein J6Z23_08540, partial [Lachnospiraceae bacterium]|nr:hypothetical protein [Lachnospiraceae bacterium]
MRRAFNPNLAHLFYLAGFIESWGRGVEKICHILQENGLPMPEYTIHPGNIMIRFTGPEDRIVRVSGRLSEKLSDKLSDKLPEQVPEKVPEKVSERVPEKVPERVHEKVPERVPEGVSERVPE